MEVPPALVGSPDAVAIAPGMGEPGSDGCCAPPRRAPRTGPLPAPRIVISPPVKIARGSPGLGRAQPGTSRAQPVARTGSSPSRGRSSQALTRDEARRAADRSEWADVLLAAASAPDDEVLRDLVDRANRWAHERLASAALDIREGRYDEGLAAVEAVLVQMGGQPVAVDANRGLGAIQTLLELRHLNPDGAVAKTVRRNAQAEYRGTRWSSLF